MLLSVSLSGDSRPFSRLFFTSPRYLGVALLYSLSLLQCSVSESLNCSFLLCLRLFFFGGLAIGAKSVEDIIYGISAVVIVASAVNQRL